MKSKIHVLMVEDDASDAELIKVVLRNEGLNFQARRVEMEADLEHELKQRPPDIILADHGFPAFDGFAALALAREHCPDVPFIFVTGALGEEVAITSLKKGATDYVLKNRLWHLPPAVRRALREVDERSARRRVEMERDQLIRELKEELAQIKTLNGLLPVCTLCKQIRDHQSGWQPMEIYLQAHTNITLTHELCPQCAQKLHPALFKGGRLYPELRAGA